VVRQLDNRLVRDALDHSGLVAALGAAFELAAEPKTASRARAIAEEFGIDQMTDRMLAVHDLVRGRMSP
jgi:hypothetical protein